MSICGRRSRETLGKTKGVADRTRDVTEEATPTTPRSAGPADPGDAADPGTRENKLYLQWKAPACLTQSMPDFAAPNRHTMVKKNYSTARSEHEESVEHQALRRWIIIKN